VSLIGNALSLSSNGYDGDMTERFETNGIFIKYPIGARCFNNFPFDDMCNFLEAVDPNGDGK
jgi:hypothetical protein